MEKKFVRVRTVKDIVIFTSLIFAGLVLAVIPGIVEIRFAGYAIIAIGTVLACFLKNGYKDVETQEKYYEKEFLFPGIMKSSILSALILSPGSIDLTQDGKGQALMLKMYYSKTSGKAYLQLFEFVPHQYESCSEMYEYEINKVVNLLK